MNKWAKRLLPLAILFLIAVPCSAKDKNTVAVLPFAVHSGENIDYVRQGILDMLSSRVYVADKIEVVGKDAVAAALKEAGGKELSLSDVYAMGKKLNADFVVWGSITKIGNSISIDGKLVDIAAYKSTVSLFAQSQGMDEVIPKINDFAQRIDAHILGVSPASVQEAQAPSQPAAAAQAGGAFSKESEIISGMRKSRAGTFTSAINPDYINSDQVVDRRGFWMSQKFPTEFKGMDIGDVNGDKLNETVMIDNHNVIIYQLKGKDFKQIQTIKGGAYEDYIAVDVADINGNGLKEIFVTSISRSSIKTFVLEYQGGKFVKTADLPWCLRVINRVDEPILLGQQFGTDSVFNTPIHEIVWRNGKYEEGKRMKIPLGLSIYGLTIDELISGSSPKVIALDEYDHLVVFEQTEKPLDKLRVFGGSSEFLYKTDDVFGGCNTSFEISDHDIGADREKMTASINLRILTYDLNKDGKKEIIIVKNISAAGRMMKSVNLFTSSEVYNLEWDGLGLYENWRTRKIDGYVADYQVKDIDNDGQHEIVMALVTSSGVSLTGRSVVVYFKFNLPQPATR